MSDSSPTESAGSIKPFIKPVAVWLVACGLAFGTLALGMDQVAKRLPVDSPGIQGLTDNGGPGGGAPGQASSRSYPSPSFSLATLEGRELGPQDFLGQVVVIDLWATWCGPCRMQARYLETLHQEYEGEGVQFLAVNSGEDLSAVEAFVKRTPFPYPVLMDPNETVMRRYQSTGLPTMMIVDITGQISFFRVGVADTATLRREIEKARKGPNPQLAV